MGAASLAQCEELGPLRWPSDGPLWLLLLLLLLLL